MLGCFLDFKEFGWRMPIKELILVVFLIFAAGIFGPFSLLMTGRGDGR